MDLGIWKVQTPIIQSDVTVYSPPLRGLWVMGIGLVSVADVDGNIVTWNVAAVPFFIPLEIAQVRDSITNVANSDLIGGW